MLPRVAFPCLILLWADVVVSQTRVTGVVGQTITLPCSYSTAREIAPMCWGRESCPLSKCSNSVAWTDGYLVTFTKNKRYRMNGIISKGELSLTIENATLSDTGMYCCRIEFSGWFNDYKKNMFLEIKPAPSTVPTPPKPLTSAPTTPATTKNLKTAPPKVTSVPTPPKVTSVPTPPKVSTYAPTTPAPTWNLQTAPPKVTMGPTSPMVSMSASTKQAGETTASSAVPTTKTQSLTPQETSTTSSSLNSSCLTDGNSTVTQPSDCGWQYNKTHTILKKKTLRNTSKLYIGLGIAAMVLLIILAAILTKKYLCGKRKMLHISKEPVLRTSQNEAAVHYQAQENICFENNLYNVQ